MDLIKIINLLREIDFPESFEDFANEYLDEKYTFTNDGAERYLDHISGLISYLNREKDIRQFAYPVFYDVKAYMSKKPELEDAKWKTEIEDIKGNIAEKKLVKAKTKEEKQIIKDDISILKAREKELKGLIKVANKTVKDDISQETALNLCLKK
jgi:hypothetical protein